VVQFMTNYRAYALGHDGHFVGVQVLLCADDAEAIESARRLFQGQVVELWCGDRLIVQMNESRSNLERPAL
jgi:hypothetical protein